MNDPLDTRLRDRLSVSEARVAAVLAGTRSRIRRGWALRAAAAFLLPLVAGAGLLALPTEPRVLVFARTGERGESNYEPPGLGLLRRESDAAVIARVLDVSEKRVSLAVEEVLYGPPGVEPTSVPEDSRRVQSCSRYLEWTAGERCILFLWRDPETRAFEVASGGSGKITFPWSGIFDLEVVETMIRTGTIPVPVLADLVDRHGPRAVLLAKGDLWGHPDEFLPDDAGPVQDAVARWLTTRFTPDGSDGYDVVAALDTLRPERLAALPERVGAGLRESTDRLTNLYTRLERLLPLVRAGIPGALADLAAWQERADQVVARPLDGSWWRALARARAAQARWQPEDALPHLWRIYESRKLAGMFDRGDVLDLLLDVDPERAGKALLAYTKAAVAAGYAPKVELLARLTEPEATEALRTAVAAPELGAGWYRPELRDVFLGPDGKARLAACAPAIAARIRRGKDGPKHLAVWVELLAATEAGIAPVRGPIRDALAAASGDVEDRTALVRAVQDALGARWLVWLDPTEKELTAAEAAAIRALD